MRILIVDEIDTSLGPMLAQILRRELDPTGTLLIEVQSAGWNKAARDGRPVAPTWHDLQSETMIDLGAYKSRWIGDVDVMNFDLVVYCDNRSWIEILRYYPAFPVTKSKLANPHRGGITEPHLGRESFRTAFRTMALSAKEIKKEALQLR